MSILQEPTMKKSSTIFLQVVIILLGIVVLFVMIQFPLTEGRAVNLDLLSIYSDPFIVFSYLASIPFFVALYQGFKLLRHIRQNKVFSLNSVKALGTIKYCAIVLTIFIVIAGIYIKIFHAEGDDPAGFLAMCVVAAFVSIVTATAAAVFEKTLQSAVEMKLENDLII